MVFAVCAVMMIAMMITMSATAANVVIGPATVSMGADVTIGSPTSAGLHEQYTGVGNDVTVYVSAAGAGLTYQWRKGGVDIAGATDSGLTLANVVLADAGTYDCVVSGTCGLPATTLPVTVAIYDPLTGTPILPIFECPLGTISLMAIPVGGKTPYTYEWFADYGVGPMLLQDGASPGGGVIAGAGTLPVLGAANLTITNAGALDAADYSCSVNDAPLINDPDI